MRLLDRAADRLVGLLAPKTTARAVDCSGPPFSIFCSGCHERTYYSKSCCESGSGDVYCGGCQPHVC